MLVMESTSVKTWAGGSTGEVERQGEQKVRDYNTTVTSCNRNLLTTVCQAPG